MGTFKYSGGVEVIGFISPTDPNDQYPVIDPLYGIDGFRNVNTLSDLNNIPNLRRRAGMVVGVSGGTTYYKLNPSPWLGNISDWSLFQTGGGSVSGEYLPLSGGTVTGNTIFTLGLTSNTISATTYQNLPVSGLTAGNNINVSGVSGNFTISVTGLTQDYLPLSGGTVSGDTKFTSGLTANTISASTYYNYPTFTGGTVSGGTNFTSGLTANTLTVNGVKITGDTYTTGGTYNNNGSINFNYNNGTGFTVTGLYTGQTSYVNSISVGTGLSANTTTGIVTIINTEPDKQVTITGGTNIEILGSYPNFGVNFTGNTSGNYLPLSGGTVSGATSFTSGITANTISATTYSNLPQYYSGIISGSTNWVNNNDGSITLPNLQTALFSTSDFSGPLNLYIIPSTTFTLNNNDTNYIVVDYNNGNPTYSLLNDDGPINDSSVILYLIIYRTNNFLHILEFGDYGAGLPNKLNDRVLMTDRFAHESGCILGLSGNTGIVTLSDGTVWNGVYRQVMSAVTSSNDVFFQNYHIGGNWVYSTSSTTLNNQYYDNGFDLVLGLPGKYLVNWYFRGQEVNDHLYEVFGNNEYNSVAEAELSLEPLLPELITSHAFLVGRIIVGVGETTGSTQTAFVTPFVSTQVTNHQDLLGLQGGGPGEYYHLTISQYNTLSYTNINNNFTSDQTINGGLTATTISATTYQNLPTDVRVTGGTYSGGTTIFTNNTGGTFSVSGYYTGSTDNNQYVTGFTYNNNTFTIGDNSGNTFNATVNTVTGVTVNGNLTVTGNTSLKGLTATTISATTYQNLPTDVRVTGGTYSNGTATFTNNTGGTFSVSGFSTANTFTGGTVSGTTNFTNGLTATTISATTYQNLPVSGVTGGTGISATTSNGVVTITNTSPNQTVTISGGTNIQIAGTYPNFGVNFTGTTGGGGGDYLPLSGGTVSGATNFTNGLTTNTISGGTYVGDGSQLNVANPSTGTTITFTAGTIYNSPTSAATGNISGDTTNAKIGIVQKIYHNDSVAPTFNPSGWVKLGSSIYLVSTLNIIYAEWVSGTRVEYWIVQ